MSIAEFARCLARKFDLFPLPLYLDREEAVEDNNSNRLGQLHKMVSPTFKNFIPKLNTSMKHLLSFFALLCLPF